MTSTWFVFNKSTHSYLRSTCSTHSGVTCHSSAAAKQRAGPATQQTQLWFHGQTWAHIGSRHLAVEEPPEFGYELHRRRQLIALTARAHQQPIHKYRVLISPFGLHSAKRIIV